MMAPIHWIGIAAFVLVCVVIAFAVSGGSGKGKRAGETPGKSGAVPPRRESGSAPRAEDQGSPSGARGDVSARVDELIRQGSKIQAIAQVREETGLGLKDAKDLVEARERGIAAGLRPEPAEESDGGEAGVVPSAAVVDLARRGEKIMAIKLLREESGLGLAEAKKIVDSLEAGR